MTDDADHPDVLILSRADTAAAGAISAIAQTPGITLRLAERIEAAEAILGGAGSDSVHLIVIGPDIERPLLVARQLRRLSPFSQFLFLRSKDHLNRISDTLGFLPDLSGAWAVDADTGPEQIQQIIAEAVAVSRADRQASALPEKLNLMLERADARKQALPRRQSSTLWQSFFSAVLSQAPDPIFATDSSGTLLTWNDAAVPFFGIKPEDIGDSAQPLQLPEPWLEAVRNLLHRAAAGQRISQHEVRLPRADGNKVDLSLSLAPVRDEQDRVVCISFTARDISEQKHLEREQHLLVRELNHRVKNVLALVHSIARRTAQNTHGVGEFLSAFDGRLQAMSAAHGLLSDSWWRGAALPDLAGAVLDLHLRDSHVVLELPNTKLSPALASSLALVLNELGTNAVKHGALSTASGRILLTGREVVTEADESEHRLELEWREEGGPPVSAPEQTGFGSRLITQLIAYQHQGHVDMNWAETGLICRMVVPLARSRAA